MGAAGMALDHEGMDCCTQECAISCPSGVLPVDAMIIPDGEDGASPAVQAIAEALHSVEPARTDPPPRLPSV